MRLCPLACMDSLLCCMPNRRPVTTLEVCGARWACEGGSSTDQCCEAHCMMQVCMATGQLTWCVALLGWLVCLLLPLNCNQRLSLPFVHSLTGRTPSSAPRPCRRHRRAAGGGCHPSQPGRTGWRLQLGREGQTNRVELAGQDPACAGKSTWRLAKAQTMQRGMQGARLRCTRQRSHRAANWHAPDSHSVKPPSPPASRSTENATRISEMWV